MADYFREELIDLEKQLMEARDEYQLEADLSDGGRAEYYGGKVAGLQEALTMLRDLMAGEFR